MKPPRLILASASPRRDVLLRQIGLSFEVIPSESNESQSEQLSPFEICQLNAYRKARSVAKLDPDAVVLGADTLVCLGHELLGKPADLPKAEEMLKRLQGRTHQVVTGVCLIHLRDHRQATFADSTDVTFHPLGTAAIRRYLESIKPLDKAGGYAIQEHGELIVKEIAGSYSNVVGLPVERVASILRNWGMIPPLPEGGPVRS